MPTTNDDLSLTATASKKQKMSFLPKYPVPSKISLTEDGTMRSGI